MLISHKYKFIFIHIPKCAGSSVSSCLIKKLYPDATNIKKFFTNFKSDDIEVFKNSIHKDTPQALRQHDNYTSIKNYLYSREIDIKEYFTFSFMRNPWERAVSRYYYGKKMATKSKEPWALKIANLSFLEFITSQPQQQLKWVEDIDGEVAVDFLSDGRFIQEDFDIICDKIGITKQNLPHSNKSDHKYYTEYYDNKTRKVIEEQSLKDIDYFGYKFGEYNFFSPQPKFLNEFNIPIDTSKREVEDQQKAKTWISKNDIVLELGGRYGTVSHIINKKLNNPNNHVVVEPDERVWSCLENNRNSNSCKFHIVKGFISNEKLSLTNLDEWFGGYGSHSIKDDSSNTPNYTLADIKNKYNLNFNTLFADCEGFLPTFLDENPDVLDSFYKIIFEADRIKDLPEGIYDEVKKKLQKKDFTCRESGHFNVYIKY